MLNLFKLPIEKSSLEAWSKLSDDVAKVDILAMLFYHYRYNR